MSRLKQLFCTHKHQKPFEGTIAERQGYQVTEAKISECLSCGLLTKKITCTRYRPEGGFQKGFWDFWRVTINTLGVDLDRYGSWYQLNFPCIVHDIWKNENSNRAIIKMKQEFRV